MFIQSEKLKLEEKKKLEEKDVEKITREKEHRESEISRLEQELELTRKRHESHCLQLEENANEAKVEFEKKLKDFERELIDSKKKVKELESFAESKSRRWKRKERTYQSFVNFQFGALQVWLNYYDFLTLLCAYVDSKGLFNDGMQELRAALESTKHQILKNKRSCSEEFNYLGT